MGQPELFRSGGYLLNIGNQAVEVAAIYTIHLFNEIQITETVTIQVNIVTSSYLRDAIFLETDKLIPGNNCIHEQSR
jgi:hypothetical protein